MRISDWSSDVCSSDLFVPSTTARKAIGSLVLGYHRGGKLIHAGRVGTGFTQKVAAALFKRLDKMKQTKSPFAKKLTAEAARQMVFVRPEKIGREHVLTPVSTAHIVCRLLHEKKNKISIILSHCIPIMLYIKYTTRFNSVCIQ